MKGPRPAVRPAAPAAWMMRRRRASVLVKRPAVMSLREGTFLVLSAMAISSFEREVGTRFDGAAGACPLFDTRAYAGIKQEFPWMIALPIQWIRTASATQMLEGVCAAWGLAAGAFAHPASKTTPPCCCASENA